MAEKSPLRLSKKPLLRVAKQPEAWVPTLGAAHWDAVYQKPLGEIPWEIEHPPKELVALLASGRVKFGKATGALMNRGRALDVACGSGNYSVFLAKSGFQVTGVDFSENALKVARKKALGAGVSVEFVRADVRHLLSAVGGKRFDFILDWSLLHHIAPADLNAYAVQFADLLAPGGLLLLSCFSDTDAPDAGQKSATGKMGNLMFYRTREEIEAAYGPLKAVQYAESRFGKKGTHRGHCFLFERQ